MKRFEFFRYFVVATAIFFTESAATGTSAFVYSASNQFGVVDLSTGSYTSIGRPDTLLSSITSMAGRSMLALDESFNLRSIDPTTAQTTLIGSTSAPIFGIEENSSGAVFGQTGSSLYSINPTTGAAFLIGDFGSTLNFDLAIGTFDSVGHLFEVGTTIGVDSTVLFQVDSATGAGMFIGLNHALLESIVFDGSTLYGFTGLPSGGLAGPLVTVNPNTGLATISTSQDASLDIVLGAAIQAGSVPEPSAGILIGFGIASLFLYRLFRNRTTRLG